MCVWSVKEGTDINPDWAVLIFFHARGAAQNLCGILGGETIMTLHSKHIDVNPKQMVDLDSDLNQLGVYTAEQIWGHYADKLVQNY